MHKFTFSGMGDLSRWTLAVLFGASVIMVDGCRDSKDAPNQLETATEVPATAALPDRQLLFSLDGVWTTAGNAGFDDAETVFRIRVTEDGRATQMTVNNQFFKNEVDDVDVKRQIIALRPDVRGNPGVGNGETLTFLKVPDPKGNGFHLRITFSHGKAHDLFYVRRLAPDDIAKLDKGLAQAESGDVAVAASTSASNPAAIARPILDPDAVAIMSYPGTEAYWEEHCATPAKFIARAICRDSGLRAQFDRLSEQFHNREIIEDEPVAPDSHIQRRTAEKQLDACTNSECIKSTLMHWIRYMEENYGGDEAAADMLMAH